MNIAICDDEQEDLSLFASYCRQYDPGLSVVLFSSSRDLLEAFPATFYDLVFLDIEMEQPNGYDTALELRKQDPKPEIIFVTKNLTYSVRGYGVALRYLPKPVSYEMFSSALHQALGVIAPRNIAIPHRGGQKILRISDIMYMEVIRHQVILHMVDGTKLEFRGSMRSVTEQLQHPCLVRTHKSYCVNLQYVDRVSVRTVTMTSGDVIPIGRNTKASFEGQLQEFLRRNGGIWMH